MNIGDLIYSMITLILMVLIILSPLLRKIFKSAEKSTKGAAPSQDSIYESVDSHRVVNRILEEMETVPDLSFKEPPMARHVDMSAEERQFSPADRIEKLSPLKKAVLWKEILDRPAGWF